MRKRKLLSSQDYYLYRYPNIARTGILSVFLKIADRMMERPFPEQSCHKRVLELGATSDFHLKSVRHSFDEYTISDVNIVNIESPPPARMEV